MHHSHQKVGEALQAFARGEIVVVTDDHDRENEGDLIVAAAHCTAQKMAFIIRHTSGIVCAPMTNQEAKRLNLPPMVADNDAPHATAFTVSIDFKHGTTTGISAEDRTLTVRNLANENASASDFVRPGHIFPLVAQQGGVLTRSGHTEAAVDLCRLAGLPPVGVICELVNDDGTVMRGPQVMAFAAKHGLREVSVAELIAYRMSTEALVECVACVDVDTQAGAARAYSYRLAGEDMCHLAIVYGDVVGEEGVPVIVHVEDVVADILVKGPSLIQSMQVAARGKCGIVVYLRGATIGFGHASTNCRVPGEDHDQARLRGREWRKAGLGAQILRDLGVISIASVSSGGDHLGLEGFGISIQRGLQPELA